MLYPFSLTLDLYIQAESFEEAKKSAEAYVQDASLDTTDYPEIVQDVLEDGEYIPSLGQLNLMAHYMDELNKAFAYVSASPLSSAWYWSSTEYSQGSAWFVSFSNGITSYNYKYNSGRVRTVIDF
nr:MAG: Protein of unknown function (DUF1566) [Bacteriophage sp.]